MKSRHHLAAVGAALVVTLALGACATGTPEGAGEEDAGAVEEITDASGEEEPTQAADPGASPVPTGHLRVGNQQVPQGWDVDDWGQAHFLSYFTAVFDTLLRSNSEGTVSPGVAHSWEFDETRTQLTLELVPDVEFTDGTPLDADAVVANLLRFRESTGARAHDAALIADVIAIDPVTVLIELSEPDPGVLFSLARPLGMMSSPASWDDPDVNANPVGSGPYILDADASVRGASYTFRHNPGYWDTSWQRFETVTVAMYADGTAMANAFLGGQIDAGTFIGDLGALDQLQDAGLIRTSWPLDWHGLVLFDRDGTLIPELADVRVRQAINYALDTHAMLEVIVQGNGTATDQAFGPVTAGHLPELDNRYLFDPDRARELMAEAAPDGFTMTMPVPPVINSATLAQVQQMLRDIGIELVIEPVDGTAFFGEVASGRHPLILMSLSTINDWRNIQSFIQPSAQWNPLGSERAEITEWIRIIQTGTEAESAQAAQDLNRYLVEEAWFAPMWMPDVIYLTNDSVSLRPPADNVVPPMYLLSPAG